MSYGAKTLSSSIIKPRSSLLDGLVAYYELDEESGMAVNVHNNIHMTANNSPGSDQSQFDRARTFTAAGGANLTAASQPLIQAGTSVRVTLAAWVYLTSIAAAGGILCRWGGSTNEFALWFIDTDGFSMSVNGGNRTAATFGMPSTNTWYFVVGWFDGSNNSNNVQVNNEAIDTSTHAESAAGNSSLCLGAVSNGDRSLNGRVDKAGYWKRLLLPGERAWLYNAGRGLKYPFNPQ